MVRPGRADDITVPDIPDRFVVFGFVAFVVAIAYVFAHFAARERRERLAALARGLRFTLLPDDEAALAHAEYDRFAPFGRGAEQTSYNLIVGERNGVRYEMFDYRFETGSDEHKTTHRYGVVVARVPMRFKRMRVRPEGLLDQAGALAGFDDINFELHEFSARYHVSCEDREYAYQLIHPLAIEFLMGCPTLDWQFDRSVIVIHCRGHFEPRELPRIMQAVEGFVALIPNFVREDCAHTGEEPFVRSY